MSVKASCDTEKTSAHLAGGRATTIVAAEETCLLAVRVSLYRNSTEERSRTDEFYTSLE
jgi:hypothetical protein